MTVIMKYGQNKFDSILYIALCYLFTSIISFMYVDLSEFNTTIFSNNIPCVFYLTVNLNFASGP